MVIYKLIKKLSCTLFVTFFLVSASVFSADGPLPKCQNQKLNLVVYNKNLPDGNCSSPEGEGKYCVYLSRESSSQEDVCSDSEGMLWENFNDSYSFSDTGSEIDLTYIVTNKSKAYEAKNLNVIYHDGKITTNCAEVFDGDVSCLIDSSLSSKGYKTYRVTLTK
ncbi:MAG: hypothetical protein KDH94_04615 [Coxiellaceae bacterium]|nr:hypothetical protein [Coxiellaceae bacterium]